ncbi:MAG: flagellar biosynthetic protein FliR [Candidatus Coatesbacteria bacterium]|nr:flagellar biosynthetic protein FliR [Candidatus Coatesbacteria bacterium]
MELLGFSLREVQIFFLVLSRTLGVIGIAPILGGTMIPNQMKIGLSVLVSFLLFPVIPVDSVVIPGSMIQLTFGLLGELAIGIVLGFIARAALTAVEIGAQVVAMQMGLTIANVLDPMSGSQMSVIALFQSTLAVLIFVTINAHHWLLEALAQSFQAVQPLAVVLPRSAGLLGVNVMRDLFIAAMKIAAPGIVILLMITVLMGVIARTVPQINILIVGFPLKIGIGLLVLGVSMIYFVDEVVKLFEGMRSDLSAVLTLFGG